MVGSKPISMRQLISEISINPSSHNGTQQGNDYGYCSGSDLCKKRSGTSSCNCPAKSEDQSAINLAFTEFLRGDRNLLSINCFDVEFFDDPNGNHSCYHCTSYNTVHMERLQAEHFLNSEPADYFCFYKHNPECTPHQKVLQKMIPSMLNTTFVGANRILMSYICFFFHF